MEFRTTAKGSDAVASAGLVVVGHGAWTRCTSVVANRREAATSSATISTLDRRSPPSVSQLRCSKTPETSTESPWSAEGDVLGQVTPAHDVEEGHRLLPLLGLLVLPPAVDGDGEGGGGLALPGVAISDP